MILYFLKSSAVLLAIILFYKIFLEKEKAFVFNRAYLWVGLIFSFASPFFIYEVPVELSLISDPEVLGNWAKYPSTALQNLTLTEENNSIQGLNWLTLMGCAYIFLSGILLIKFLVNLTRMTRSCLTENHIKQGKYRIISNNRFQVPHSFFNYIFLPKNFEASILEHEKRHVDAYHSFDVILLELIQVIFWVNPLIHWHKKIVLLNHEFYADQQNTDNNIKQYQELIFSHIAKDKVNLLASGFNYSFIKKRMIMLQRSRSGPLLWAKKILVLPLFTMLLFIACEKVEGQKKTTKHDLSNNVPAKSKIFAIVDGHDVNDLSIFLKSDGQEINQTGFRKLVRNGGMLAFDQVNFKVNGAFHRGNELRVIDYSEKREDLFMRKLRPGDGIIRISSTKSTDGLKYRSVILEDGTKNSVTYDGELVPPPPPPPFAPAPPSATGITPPPTPPAPPAAPVRVYKNAPSPPNPPGAIPPPPPPAPPKPPKKKKEKDGLGDLGSDLEKSLADNNEGSKELNQAMLKSMNELQNAMNVKHTDSEELNQAMLESMKNMQTLLASKQK